MEKATFKEWFLSRKVQRWLVISTFMFVPLLLLIVFTYVPFLKMVQFSFYNMKYLGARKFVGWKNYIDVFKREDCFKSLLVSVYYMGGALVQLALALFFATLMVFKVRGSSIFKGAMFFPYLICGIAVGFIFKFFYARGFVLDSILQMFGMDLENIPYWLQDQRINNISLAATSVWRYTGQNMILSISGSLSAFEPSYVITNGTMGTGTYFVIMNRLAHENQKVGLACAMAIVLLVIIILCTVAQKLFFAYIFNDGTADESKAAMKRRLKAEREAAKAARKGGQTE